MFDPVASVYDTYLLHLQPSLNTFLELGKDSWRQVRSMVQADLREHIAGSGPACGPCKLLQKVLLTCTQNSTGVMHACYMHATYTGAVHMVCVYDSCTPFLS
jgi:hypothetical protein